mmetsp:Transcript_20153/g.27223  ORF Transcript_20153/g.27223 Transcript_20153/m.27223 type:complete len:505 (-) Transcript_20153:373-1887(-)|eukprot:CAMPEP_0185593902 /NCGR_PEP_ID=MMETSP0434-20130131/73038_1 /TAXON_ID=626734 ORGANISM="Favella taraikaensis, Strain Fe Narragansett Bay" /NCGR_SAMPLE_ID=MMETSP0434 /ASSEMBLY_ACC=CAM_ASM_000379 /LENGTH=504 /DNA_ID=CAMNT_0028220847 /DNA_START=2193 /DNA_END=3707 /DNA_ORIENTATION=+
MRYESALAASDFSNFSEADKLRLIDELSSTSVTWQSNMTYMMLYITFPLGIFNKYVYCRLTERPFIWLPTYSADFLIIALLGYSLHYHFAWLDERNPGLHLQAEPSDALMYIHAYNEHVSTFELNVTFYLGLMSLAIFIRQLLSYQVTSLLGPIISTILVMFSDVAQFIVIWLIVLLGYSFVGFISFQAVPELRQFKDSFAYFFMAAFGSFDISIFDVFLPRQPVIREIGLYFVLSFVFLNLLVLINVVIAMMADTYAAMTSFKQGIYNHNILKTAPSYKLDKRYGGLTILPGPAALISFMALPFYALVKDRDRLERFNKGFYFGFYGVVCLVISSIFLAINLLLVPFAYLKTCAHKVSLVSAGVVSACDALSYVLLGLPMGVAVQVFDMWGFLKSSWNMDRAPRSDATFVISRDNFEMFYKVVRGHELKKKPVKAFDLIFQMRDMMKLESQIMTSIYGVDISQVKAAEEKQAAANKARADVDNQYVRPNLEVKSLLGNFSDAV